MLANVSHALQLLCFHTVGTPKEAIIKCPRSRKKGRISGRRRCNGGAYSTADSPTLDVEEKIVMVTVAAKEVEESDGGQRRFVTDLPNRRIDHAADIESDKAETTVKIWK